MLCNGKINFISELIETNIDNIPFNEIKIKQVKELSHGCPGKGFKWRKLFALGLTVAGYLFSYYDFKDGFIGFIFNWLTLCIIYGLIGAFIGLFIEKKPIDVLVYVTDSSRNVIQKQTNTIEYEAFKKQLKQTILEKYRATL